MDISSVSVKLQSEECLKIWRNANTWERDR
jgi:hypothetical protein